MSLRRLVAGLGVFVTLAASPPLVAQEGGLAVLEAAAARYGAASSVCADFVQLRAVPILRQEVTQRGRLCSADPNLFAMRFTDPEGNVVELKGPAVA